MARKTKKETSKTIREYHKWRNIHYALKAAPFITVSTPFAIELAANWSTWFPEGGNHTSVAMGLAMALVSTILSILAIVKKDSELMKKVGAFVSVGIAFLAWGAVCIFLSSVLMELGKLLVFSGCGILAAAVEDAVDKNAVKEKYLFLKKVADENGLTTKGEWEYQAQEQAKADMIDKYGESQALDILNERKVRK